MSLKAVHLTFIILATLLSFSLGAWFYGHYRQFHEAGDLVLAVVSLILTAVLLGYGIWFVGKIRREGGR